LAAAGIAVSTLMFNAPIQTVTLPTGERIGVISLSLDVAAMQSAIGPVFDRRVIVRYISTARNPEERVLEADHALAVAVEAADSLHAAAIVMEQHRPFIGRWTHFTTGYAFTYSRDSSGRWQRRVSK
jgi:hypothetical protein